MNGKKLRKYVRDMAKSINYMRITGTYLLLPIWIMKYWGKPPNFGWQLRPFFTPNCVNLLLIYFFFFILPWTMMCVRAAKHLPTEHNFQSCLTMKPISGFMGMWTNKINDFGISIYMRSKTSNTFWYFLCLSWFFFMAES